MGIARGWRTVRSPTGVANAGCTVNWGAVYQLGQAGQFSGITADLDPAILNDSQTG
jgi:hypothetical protein